jgi:hypothetical protein
MVAFVDYFVTSRPYGVTQRYHPITPLARRSMRGAVEEELREVDHPIEVGRVGARSPVPGRLPCLHRHWRH